MPKPLIPHRARYAYVRPDGSQAGTEEVEVSLSSGGWSINTRIHAAWPEEIVATVDWDLDGDLVTRLLRIVSLERFSGESELELTVTGNGLLAHRRAPDGPTQVELGWGPNAELEYISAAFPAVMLARSGLEPGAVRQVDAVHIGTIDLVPTVIPLLLRGTPGSGTSRSAPGLGTVLGASGLEAARGVEFVVVETGHHTTAAATAEGVLLSYTGLLRLTSLEASK
jgi:hypothetical protein